jgi:hypothetical protein
MRLRQLHESPDAARICQRLDVPFLATANPMPNQSDPERRAVIKIYATGKVFGFVTGDGDTAEPVKAALSRSIVLAPRVDEERFAQELEARGISRGVADRYLESVDIADEAWLQDKHPDW